MNKTIGKYSLYLFTLICALKSVALFAQTEEFNGDLEEASLKNIRQITFPSMGFEKAGEAYFSPDGNTIIFQAVPKGEKNYQIYTLALNEVLPRMVSTGHGACTCAYFRPDGKKIIFASSHEDPNLDAPNPTSAPGYQRSTGQYSWEFTPYMNIYEANPDGSALKALTQGEAYHAECAYSPDGSHIVFASNLSNTMNIYTMKADGSEVNQVTMTIYSYNGGPFYSPDGSKILFRSDRDKPHYLQLYTINSDGTDEQQLTFNDAVNWAPYWHPAGNVIAYTTSLHGHSHYEIYLMNIKTNVQHRLTHNPSFDGIPVFSNDGSKIMWTSKSGPDNTCQIFLSDFTMPQELK